MLFGQLVLGALGAMAVTVVVMMQPRLVTCSKASGPAEVSRASLLPLLDS